MYLFFYNLLQEQIQSQFLEVRNGYNGEIHRMYISRNFSELKSKIKKTFKIDSDIQSVNYRDNYNKICVRTEEDYEIMLLSKINEKIIEVFFDKV